MNPLTILILIIIVVSLIYVYYSFNPTYLIEVKKLTEIQTFTSDKIDVPSSSRYCYEGWFHVVNNFPPDKVNVLFNRGTGFVLYLKQSKLVLGMNGHVSSVDASGRATLANPPAGDSIVITDAYPFQKWTYIVINVDGANIDIYLDGRLIANKTTTIQFNGSDSLVVGNQYMDGRVAHFTRYGFNMNPQEVWNKYMYGSGQSDSASNYNVKVGILKNNVQKNEFKLF